MKRAVACLAILIILGAFAGCKSKQEDPAAPGINAGNHQLPSADDSENNTEEKEEPEAPSLEQPVPDASQQGEKPSQDVDEERPQQPSEQQKPDPKPEQEQEQGKEQEEGSLDGGGPLFTAKENPYQSSLKILAIGNSFSKDAMQHLWDVAKDYGAKEVILGNLYIGGCSLETHYENMSSNSPAYAYYKNESGSWVNNKNTSVLTALQDEKWDIITLQQASDQNADGATYACLPSILRYLEQHKPARDTKLLWHMTWAYQSDSTKKAFAEYGYDQIKMYEALLKRVQNDVLFYDNFAGVIPVGTAIQNLRKTSVGDTLTRDGYHMSYGMGRYVVALTWYCYITGADPNEAAFAPTEDQAEIFLHRDEINKAVADAIRNPYEIT